MTEEEIKEYLRRVDELEQAILDIKEYVEYYTNEYPGCKAAEFDIMANPHFILDIINNVIKEDK